MIRAGRQLAWKTTKLTLWMIQLIKKIIGAGGWSGEVIKKCCISQCYNINLTAQQTINTSIKN